MQPCLPKLVGLMRQETNFFRGFDQESKMFKVLCMILCPPTMEFRVFSLLDRNIYWQKVDCNNTPLVNCIDKLADHHSVLLDGKIYFRAGHFKILMCFDLINEEFNIIEFKL